MRTTVELTEDQRAELLKLAAQRSLKGFSSLVSRIELELKTGRLCTTAVSPLELWADAKTQKEKTAVGTLLNALNVIPLDSAASSVAGEIFQNLAANGETIGMADSLIAGICLNRNSSLITRNKKHFKRVPNLKISGESS